MAKQAAKLAYTGGVFYCCDYCCGGDGGDDNGGDGMCVCVDLYLPAATSYVGCSLSRYFIWFVCLFWLLAIFDCGLFECDINL